MPLAMAWKEKDIISKVIQTKLASDYTITMSEVGDTWGEVCPPCISSLLKQSQAMPSISTQTSIYDLVCVCVCTFFLGGGFYVECWTLIIFLFTGVLFYQYQIGMITVLLMPLLTATYILMTFAYYRKVLAKCCFFFLTS